MAGSRFADLWIWDRVGDRLAWYFAVATNRMPAKYLIAQRVPCDLDLRGANERDLWAEHERLTEHFLDLWHAIRAGETTLEGEPTPPASLLDLSAELVRRMLRHCTFCRWNCRVDRTQEGRRGTCQLGNSSRVSSYFHHRGEELVFRGTDGSGTIFFTSCNLRCAFCQNSDISHDKENGIPMEPRHLAAMAWELRMEGCHNINWVGGEPTIHLHTIVQAIRELARGRPSPQDIGWAQAAKMEDFFPYRRRTEGTTYRGEVNVPMLWNSNFFMSEEALRILRPLMDVWLPDFKFGNDRCAILLARTPWYWETVTGNHKTVYDWGEDLVIRHLVMPGHVECCTKPVLEWIAENMPQALVNVMDQYHPDAACDPASPRFDPRYGSMARRPAVEEILEAYETARRLGLRFEEITFEKARVILPAWASRTEGG